MVCLCDCLGVVEEVGKRISRAECFRGHSFGTVLRIGLRIIRVDRYDRYALGLILACKARELVAHMLDEWAVIANECDDETPRFAEIIERSHLAIEAGQTKRRRSRSECEHCGFSGRHG